jgi:hypothetical protein
VNFVEFVVGIATEFIADNKPILAFRGEVGMEQTKFSDFFRILNVVPSLKILFSQSCRNAE